MSSSLGCTTGGGGGGSSAGICTCRYHQKPVPAADQRRKGKVHDLLLPDEAPVDLGLRGDEFFAKPFDFGNKLCALGHDNGSLIGYRKLP